MAQVHCELNIIRLTNLDADLPSGKLFIRYYVYAGRGRRIRIDTREILSTCDAHWDEQSSLECEVASGSRKEAICAHNVVFELRWRRSKPFFFGTKAKSKLLGRGEVAWEDVSGLGGVPVEKRVGFITKKPVPEGEKPSMLVVRMGIRVRDLEVREKRTVVHEMGSNECKCESCGWVGSEEDMFLAANAASMD